MYHDTMASQERSEVVPAPCTTVTWHIFPDITPITLKHESCSTHPKEHTLSCAMRFRSNSKVLRRTFNFFYKFDRKLNLEPFLFAMGTTQFLFHIL